MTFNQILKDIENKIYHPLYLLWGDEPYFIDAIIDKMMESVLSESEKSFNQNVFYGKDTTPYEVSEAAKRFPMMANHQLIIVKEAQEMKSFKELEAYAENPLKSTILVIGYKYKKIDQRLKVVKNFKKNGVVFQAKRIYDNQIPTWIENYIATKNMEISPEATMLLSENVGANLSAIVNEIDKLIISVAGKTNRINTEMVEKNTGISRDFNNFELQKALGKRDKGKVYKIVSFFAADPKRHPAVLVINHLFSFFKKLLVFKTVSNSPEKVIASELGVHPFFVSEYKKAASNYSTKSLVNITSLLRDYDMRIKGLGAGNIQESELIKELMYKILHT